MKTLKDFGELICLLAAVLIAVVAIVIAINSKNLWVMQLLSIAILALGVFAIGWQLRGIIRSVFRRLKGR